MYGREEAKFLTLGDEAWIYKALCNAVKPLDWERVHRQVSQRMAREMLQMDAPTLMRLLISSLREATGGPRDIRFNHYVCAESLRRYADSLMDGYESMIIEAYAYIENGEWKVDRIRGIN